MMQLTQQALKGRYESPAQLGFIFKMDLEEVNTILEAAESGSYRIAKQPESRGYYSYNAWDFFEAKRSYLMGLAIETVQALDEEELNKWARAEHLAARAQGWYDDGPVNFGEQCSNMSAEVSELWEHHRSGTLELESEKIPGHTNCAEELSDLLLRALDRAEDNKVNIGEAMKDKLLYNLQKRRQKWKKV